MTSDSQFSAPTRPRRRPGENRERLIEAGLIEFGLFGYHGASTAGIAARAEVPQPHVYASFPSKGALFLAVVRRVAERLAEPTAERLAERAAEPIAERTAEHAVGRLVELNLSGAGPEDPAGTRGGLLARVPAEPAAEAPTAAAAADTPAAASLADAPADAPAAVDGRVLRADDAAGEHSTEGDAADAARVLLQAIALTADTQLGQELRLELSTLRTRIGASAFDRLVLRGAEQLLARPDA